MFSFQSLKFVPLRIGTEFISVDKRSKQIIRSHNSQFNIKSNKQNTHYELMLKSTVDENMQIHANTVAQEQVSFFKHAYANK